MASQSEQILDLVKKSVTDALTARLKNIEDVRLKKVEVLLKDGLEFAALKDAVKKHDAELGSVRTYHHEQIAFQRKQLTDAYTAYINAEVSKMDKKLAKTELLEARMKGMETMIRAMEQTIDMLQRKR